MAGTGYNVNNSYNGLNHITTAGYAYDKAGNVTNDTFHTYTYDAEGRLLTVDRGVGNGGETYNYNSRGLRNLTHQGVWEEVLYNVDGYQEATVMPGTNTLAWSEFYAYRHIGTFTAGGLNTTLFLLPDWLGTNRYWMTQAGAYFTSSATLPYGEILSPGIGDGWTGISGLFLDYADDTVHTDARQLSLNAGRWLTPDPTIMIGNRYAYVANNPVSYIDPTGLNLAFPGQCNDGQGLCADEGGGADPSTIDNGNGGTDFSAIGNSSSDCPICGGLYGSFGTAGIANGFFGAGMLWGAGSGPPMGNNFVSAVTGGGTVDSPYLISVLVLSPFGNQGNLSSGAANNGKSAPPGVPKPPNPILQEPSKGSCTDAVGEFGLGAGATVIEGGLVVAMVLTDTEVFAGIEGLVNVVHIGVPVSIAPTIMGHGAIRTINNCF